MLPASSNTQASSACKIQQQQQLPRHQLLLENNLTFFYTVWKHHSHLSSHTELVSWLPVHAEAGHKPPVHAKVSVKPHTIGKPFE